MGLNKFLLFFHLNVLQQFLEEQEKGTVEKSELFSPNGEIHVESVELR